MSKTSTAVEWAVKIAHDNTHGYDQARRYGPDFDCSSLLIDAWERAGVPVKEAGASFTGNMLLAFLMCGFVDVADEVNHYSGIGLQAGDVLLNTANHTAMMVNATQLVQASQNERGGVTGGQSGDQTGMEIAVRSYYRFRDGWDHVLRYKGDEDDGVQNANGSVPVAAADGGADGYGLPILKVGSTGPLVRVAQRRLMALGYDLPQYKDDGDYGLETQYAVLALQNDYELTPDGEIGEGETWPVLLDNLRH